MGEPEDPLFVLEEVPIRQAVIRGLAIESVTGRCFAIKSGVRSSDGYRSHLLTYDRSGHPRRQETYGRDGKVVRQWAYGERGRPLRQTAYESSGKISYRIESIYDRGAPWSEKRVYLSGDDLHYRIVAERDAAGRLAREVYYDASGRQMRADSYLYDGRGRLARVDMGHMGEWIYEYDAEDNLKRKAGNLPSASAFGETFEFQYDGRGLLVEKVHLHYSATVFEHAFFTEG
jgi:YD repeat-containing protein